MPDPLVETRETHDRIHPYLLAAVPANGLVASPPTGGRTVAATFAHIHNVRLTRLQAAGASPPAGAEGSISTRRSTPPPSRKRWPGPAGPSRLSWKPVWPWLEWSGINPYSPAHCGIWPLYMWVPVTDLKKTLGWKKAWLYGRNWVMLGALATRPRHWDWMPWKRTTCLRRVCCMSKLCLPFRALTTSWASTLR